MQLDRSQVLLAYRAVMFYAIQLDREIIAALAREDHEKYKEFDMEHMNACALRNQLLEQCIANGVVFED